MERDDDKWNAFMAETYDRLVTLFVNGSNELVQHSDGSCGSASVMLADMALDNDEVFALLMMLLCKSESPDVVALREKAGRIWAEKHCLAQAIFDEKHLKDDSHECY